MKTAIQLTAKIWEAREAMRGLFGSGYFTKTAPWREAILSIMARAACNELEAILHIHQIIERKTQMNGMEIALLLSAAADLIEEGGGSKTSTTLNSDSHCTHDHTQKAD